MVALFILMLKTTRLFEKLASRKNNGNNVVVLFDSNNDKKIARKSEKLSNFQKTLKSKNILKSENLPKIDIKKIRTKFSNLQC